MAITMTQAGETIVIIGESSPAQFSLEKALKDSGYTVFVAASEQAAFEKWQHQSPSVIVVNRLTCRIERLRLHKTFQAVPIVALGEGKGGCEDDECVADIEQGADLVVCDQTVRQLTARIRAILRRNQIDQSSPLLYVAGSLRMDLDRHEVRVDGELVDLTPKEFQILRHFMESPGRVFSRQEMLNRVWGEGYALEEHALDVHIHSLRQKIEEDTSKPKLIVTVRGVGYKFKSGS